MMVDSTTKQKGEIATEDVGISWMIVENWKTDWLRFMGLRYYLDDRSLENIGRYFVKDTGKQC